MTSQPLKVFRCSDEDWYAAYSAHQAAELFERDSGYPVGAGFPEQLTEDALDARWPVCDEDGDVIEGRTTSFREELASSTIEPGWVGGAW